MRLLTLIFTALILLAVPAVADLPCPPEATSEWETFAQGQRVAAGAAYVTALQDEQLEAFYASLPPIPAVARQAPGNQTGILAGPTSGGGSSSGDCAAGGGGNSPLPAYITQRESHDDYCAVNSSSGAYGRYQVMPYVWDANCGDLARTPDGQDACANRLSNGGSNLRPWSG